MKPGDNRS